MAPQQETKPQMTLEQAMEIVQALALTPEKLKILAQEMNKPYIDPAAQERELRERAMIRASLKLAAENTRIRQEQCSHKYKTGADALRTMHNFPDFLPRGICVLCHLYIEPEHWEIAYDPERHEGRPYKVPAHPLWQRVFELDQALMAG